MQSRRGSIPDGEGRWLSSPLATRQDAADSGRGASEILAIRQRRQGKLTIPGYHGGRNYGPHSLRVPGQACVNLSADGDPGVRDHFSRRELNVAGSDAVLGIKKGRATQSKNGAGNSETE